MTLAYSKWLESSLSKNVCLYGTLINTLKEVRVFTLIVVNRLKTKYGIYVNTKVNTRQKELN